MFIIRYCFAGAILTEVCKTSEDMRKRIKELLTLENIDLIAVSMKE